MPWTWAGRIDGDGMRCFRRPRPPRRSHPMIHPVSVPGAPRGLHPSRTAAAPGRLRVAQRVPHGGPSTRWDARPSQRGGDPHTFVPGDLDQAQRRRSPGTRKAQRPRRSSEYARSGCSRSSSVWRPQALEPFAHDDAAGAEASAAAVVRDLTHRSKLSSFSPSAQRNFGWPTGGLALVAAQCSVR